MSLRQMEYLLAVVEERSFTRAAERLMMSQPALSHQVRALERTLGVALLERLPGEVQLTPMGRAYLPHAAAAVRSAEEARRACESEEPAKPLELRIATLYSLALGILPPAIRAWRRSYPDAHVELREFSNIDELAEQMAFGVADVAVGPRPHGWDGPLRVLGREELMLVLAADDPLAARRRSISLSELADRPWVLYASDNSLSPLVDYACSLAGFRPRAAVRTQHTGTALQLAAAGLGPALAPKSIIEADLQAAVLRPHPPVRRELVAFTTADRAEIASTFIDVLTELGAVRPRRPATSLAGG